MQVEDILTTYGPPSQPVPVQNTGSDQVSEIITTENAPAVEEYIGNNIDIIA